MYIGCMSEWMGRWMDGWMDGWMEKMVYRSIEVKTG